MLAVDDRRENLLALQAILEGLPIEIVSVTSGEDALKRLLVEDYAVILLDAHMPGMDGFETAGHVKQRERTRHIPILFLTAVDYDPHLAFRGYQAGAVDYITKPFDPWVLRSKVTVFVDLWTMHAQLADRAEECQLLRAAVDDARCCWRKRRRGGSAGQGAAAGRASAEPAVANREGGLRPRPATGALPRRQLLKTSLIFSPACLRLPLAWSAWPSASSSSSSVARPTPSLTFPFISSALLSILSSVPM